MEQPQLFHFPPQIPKNLESKAPTSAKQRHKHIMGKLKDTIFRRLSASNPSRSISQGLRSHIEKQLHEFFPDFSTPTHPPYALMIQTAIMELNEEGGSSEESISGFIEKEYEDLPWGHGSFLSHHLRKLSGTGEIVGTNDGRYMIVDGCDFGDKEEMGRRMNLRQGREMLHTFHVRDEFRRERKEEVKDCHLIKKKIEGECQVEGKEILVIDAWNKVNEKQIEVFEQWCEVQKQAVEAKSEASKQDVEATVQQLERASVELNADEQNNLQNQQLEVIEAPNHLQGLQFEVSDGHVIECGQQTIVIEDQDMPQEQEIEVMNDKKMEDQVLVTISSAFETIGQCVDGNGLSFPLKEPCMELVKKKTESQEQLMENSHSLRAMELPDYENPWPEMEGKTNDYLEVERQQLIKSPCRDRASNIEVIEGQNLVQIQDKLNREASQTYEHQIENETKIFGFCSYNTDGVSRNLGVGHSAFPRVKEQKESLKLKEDQQHRGVPLERGNFVIVCGLRAQRSETKICRQQKAPMSHPGNEQQQQSQSQVGRRLLRPKLDADTTISVSLPSGHVHEIKQQPHCQAECRDRGKPSKPEGDGDHHQCLRVYVRCRRKP